MQKVIAVIAIIIIIKVLVMIIVIKVIVIVIKVMIEVLFTHSSFFNPLSTNPIKRSNTLKQFVGKLPTNCLNVFGHFVNLALKGLK